MYTKNTTSVQFDMDLSHNQQLIESGSLQYQSLSELVVTV